MTYRHASFLFFCCLTMLVPSRLDAVTPTAKAVNGTATIDGVCEETWLRTPKIPICTPVAAVMTVPVHQAARGHVRLLWDEGHIYLFYEVTDARLSDVNGAPWEQDSVEFLIDENADLSPGYGADDCQYRVNFRGITTGGENFDAHNIRAAVRETETGYQVEAAVKLRSERGTAGRSIAADFQINDEPGNGKRQAVIKWSCNTDQSWNDTSGHGLVQLVTAVTHEELAAAEKLVAESLAAAAAPSSPAANSVSNPVADQATQATAKAVESMAKSQAPPLAAVPEWVPDAVFYQIFPERFRNGDPANDPTRDSLEFPEVVPSSWRVSSWTGDWFARDEWEVAAGEDFYDNGVFNRRYGGDLQGVLDQLDYLCDLGVTAIYFNPVFYARSLHKYDGNSFHHVDPHFGPDPAGDFELMATETADPATWKWTAADELFIKLLRQAHARGLRVIIDGVFNHCGRDFFAFADLRARQSQSPYQSWYVVRQFDDPQTAENEFKYDGWWGVDTLPSFADTADGKDLHPGPKKYIFDATRRWMDPNGDGDVTDGVDGWRLDVANEVPDQFWVDWHQLVRRLNPAAYTVAEIWTDARNYLSRTGFTATMNYHGFAFPVKGFLIDGRLEAREFVNELAARRDRYPRATRYALQNLIDSHDTDRVASMIVNAGQHEYLRAERFDYDVGERVSSRSFLDYDISKPTPRQREIQRIVALFQMTYVGPPMIYYGTEAGMWGGDDPDDRLPMLWNDYQYEPQSHHPRNRERVADAVEFDAALHDYYREIIQLRKDQASLRRGTFDVEATNDEQQYLIFRRSYAGESVLVVLNRGDAEIRLDLPPPPTPRSPPTGKTRVPASIQRWRMLLATQPSQAEPVVKKNGSQLISILPRCGVAFRAEL